MSRAEASGISSRTKATVSDDARFSKIKTVSATDYYATGSNRGTSGIEGSTSTALGAAYAVPQKQHLLITGDVSFFYDSNAFWNHYIGPNIKIHICCVIY